MVYLFDNYASFTNEILGQLLSSDSRYRANLNVKAVICFYSPCGKQVLLAVHMGIA